MAKTHRKPYSGSKRFDTSCRNHGSCSYCESRRTHKNRLRARIAWEKMKDWEKLHFLEEWEVDLIAWEAAAFESLERLDKLDENADNSHRPKAPEKKKLISFVCIYCKKTVKKDAKHIKRLGTYCKKLCRWMDTKYPKYLLPS